MKTIEEASKIFADKEYEIGQVDWDALYKGYYHGMKDLLDKPLADRLTAEEREKIRDSYIRARAFYKAENNLSKEAPEHEYQGAVWRCQMELLESIFGAEMFAEEGGEE